MANESKIVLFQPPPCWGLSSMSPFCLKLETYMRMAKIPYEVAPANFVKAPKRKVPYIKHNGKYLGDSAHIIEYLKAQFGDPLDGKLTKEQRAQALMIRRAMEEHSYFAVAWFRWTQPESQDYVRDVFLSILPPVIGKFIFKKIKKSFLSSIYRQGMGRHTREEILEMAKENILAYSVLLGDKRYFLGDQPSSLDAVMYGFLAQSIYVPWKSDVSEYVRKQTNLVQFADRVKAQYWSAA